MKTGSLPSVFECWEHKPYLIPKVQSKRKLNKNLNFRLEPSWPLPLHAADKSLLVKQSLAS